MAGGSLRDRIGASEELIKTACKLSRKAHASSSKNPYLSDKIRSSSETVFAFSGSWSVSDWFAGNNAFGEIKVDLKMFPPLRSVGTDEDAKANEAFIGRFASILRTSSLQDEVEKAVKEKKRVVFAGHSSGGPVAILATIYFLEKYPRTDSSQKPFRCITFGSPLTGDRIFPHALRRENWADCFTHFVMKYDIVPRIMLSPCASIEQQLGTILAFFNPKSTNSQRESIEGAADTLVFFMTVMRNASAVASHAACSLKGSTNLLLETLTNFIQLSPYRPFGTYIFCSGNGKLAVVKNPDAVLQLLFYCCQLNNEAEALEIASRSLKEHLGYESELKESLEMQDVVYLDPTEKLPLTSDDNALPEAATINRTLNDLGLSTTARLCLRAAGELEKQKERNQEKVNSNTRIIEEKLNSITDYQTGCRVRKIGYYDAFKLSKDINDFNANVTRLELAGMWDEVIEMLKRYELPDEFEGRKEWIELGTKFRRLVEPLDIANYYRHAKNDDTGPYMKLGRPKRYKFTQRWLEHALRKPPNAFSESFFWAVLEEKIANNKKSTQDEGEIATAALKWLEVEKKAGEDIFLDGSTFVVKWWKTLDPRIIQQSRLAIPYEQFRKNAG
ncbi:protein EDS1L-like [Cornus florida]|uniref:protein EDS1L-like n=1 Tax=Cornus florida TaxID=4283 RepID=UPI00289A2EE6|nr:protein EDS1L-like [Cornus florida]